MITPLFRPQLLQKGDGSLHIQISLGELRAELPVPEKYKDHTAEGFKEFYELSVKEMTRGLKALHKDEQFKLKMEKKRRNGYQAKRADNRRDQKSDDAADATPNGPRRV